MTKYNFTPDDFIWSLHNFVTAAGISSAETTRTFRFYVTRTQFDSITETNL
jgi:hypothetical protein